MAPAPTVAREAPRRSRWWIGVVVGAAALAVAGAVTAGVLLAPPREADPYLGNLSPGFQRLPP